MHTYFINATQFLVLESIFLVYNTITKRSLSQVLGIAIPHEAKQVYIREHYDVERYWAFDFMKNEAISSLQKKITWQNNDASDALYVFRVKTLKNRAYHDHRLKSVKNQGGFIDCATLKTVWPKRSHGWQLFANGLASKIAV